MGTVAAGRACDAPARLDVRWLGRVDYDIATAMQESRVAARRRGEVPDALWLLEHPPVITLGRRARAEDVLLGSSELESRGIALRDAGRGGEVTYHGPGQLVGYPIVAIPEGRRDLHRYLRDLETALIRTVDAFGIEGAREPERTGVWVAGKKIASIGVRVSTGWVASHGFALNVAGDLTPFDTIVPCGIRDRGMTSIAAETGAEPDLVEVAAIAAAHVAEALGLSA